MIQPRRGRRQVGAPVETHHESLALGLLLSDLLVLDGLRKLPAEGEVRDGHVVQDEVEVLRAFRQRVADLVGDGGALAQQLLGVVLRHHGLRGDAPLSRSGAAGSPGSCRSGSSPTLSTSFPSEGSTRSLKSTPSCR
eukprot:scaffold4847_cov265-Pinguiococcus_pyrenoidosus.AAC.5